MVLLIADIIFAVATVASDIVLMIYKTDAVILYPLIQALALTGENTVHWVITDAYIRTAFQTKMFLKLGTYFDARQTEVIVRRFKNCMRAVNLIVAVVIVSLSILYVFAYIRVYHGKKGLILFYLAFYLTISFQTICTIAWGVTLCALYRHVKASDKLLPNKKYFILHGVLLTSYLLMTFIGILLQTIYEFNQNDIKLYGIAILL